MPAETKSGASGIRWQLLVLVYFACLIAYLDRVNLSVAAQSIMADMGFDKIRLSYTMSAFFVGYTIMQIPGSILGEKFGVRLTAALAI
ncbi:MAG: MFS transporter, partial [Deltaproteobacteria bacterium]|nr:MFS transporter [Deltaproteobacteria bacterium]